MIAGLSLADLIPLALLGGVLGLDVVSFPQAMLSRPVVAATLAGLLMGDATSGLLLGVTLELFALETLPFGASRYPEWASASVVGGSLVAQMGPATPGVFTVALLASLALAWVGGRSMVWLRKLNARLARERLEALGHGSGRTVIGLQMLGLGADLLRGILLTGLALLVLRPGVGALVNAWGRSDGSARAVAVGLAAMVGTAAAWKLFHGMKNGPYLFAGGLVVGLVTLAVRL